MCAVNDGLFLLNGNGTETGEGNGTRKNSKQWVLVPVPILDQCEHFYMVLYFPFGSCTCFGSVPVQCECITMTWTKCMVCRQAHSVSRIKLAKILVLRDFQMNFLFPVIFKRSTRTRLNVIKLVLISFKSGFIAQNGPEDPRYNKIQ